MLQSNSPIYNLTLILLTGESAPAGPGWYVTGQAQDKNSGAHVPLRRIAVPDAEELARAFEGLVPTNQGDIGLRPFELVRQGTARAKEAVVTELERAEQIATTVPQLRKALGELGGN